MRDPYISSALATCQLFSMLRNNVARKTLIEEPLRPNKIQTLARDFPNADDFTIFLVIDSQPVKRIDLSPSHFTGHKIQQVNTADSSFRSVQFNPMINYNVQIGKI